tara:strand:- start:322 stop:684 length:363 start_codon:yes stop_codon:yes gene_type:complete
MRKILLVDDEPDVIDVIKNRLEQNEFEVIIANDGEEALHKLKSDKPDLVVLDVSMPVISGYEVCARIKHNRDYSHIPVLMLTARIKYTDRKVAQKCGADSYIPKPYSSELLIDEVNKFLN